ncbi:hypothetical protein BD777DRAFT_1459 [Yarrowia lipolytica]|nr:hypothetical protein BD777DRAFT_1459 [Yarrowia lipolytica]
MSEIRRPTRLISSDIRALLSPVAEPKFTLISIYRGDGQDQDQRKRVKHPETPGDTQRHPETPGDTRRHPEIPTNTRILVFSVT